MVHSTKVRSGTRIEPWDRRENQLPCRAVPRDAIARCYLPPRLAKDYMGLRP